MIQFVEQTLTAHWDMPAYTNYLGESYQYADVAHLIARQHIVFKETGIKRGDRIALCGPNSSRWGIAFMAVVSYGAVVVPILNDFQPDQIHNIVNHSETKLLYAAPNILKEIVPNEMPQLQGILRMEDYSVFSGGETLQTAVERLDETFRQKYGGDQLKCDQVTFEPEADENDLMMINYTSGTTGFSKGVMLPYRAFDSNYEFAGKELNSAMPEGSNVLSILPMAHMYGLLFEFLYESLHGCHIFFLTRKPTPQFIARAFQDVKPRVVVAVPLIIEKTVRMKVMKKFMASPAAKYINTPIIGWFIKRKVRQQVVSAFGGNMYECIVGGAALNQEVEAFLHSFNFPITVGYGATECAPIISYSDWKTFVPASCGRAVINMEVKIDSDDPQNKPGEILARGKNVMLGYYKNEEATRQALDDEGWYHTGDLGIMDAKGNIFIKGRKKNMLLGANGQNIYPEEIEDKINSMLMVSESLIVQREGRLEALIVPDWDEANELKLTDENVRNIMELNRHDLNEMLPAYERIQAVNIFHEEFEKTPKRSIKRYLYT
ncbi:MAG: AMP-binding protein [Prevotella sp.]|nr:AMP-binding protein [Prevotella sp.]